MNYKKSITLRIYSNLLIKIILIKNIKIQTYFGYINSHLFHFEIRNWHFERIHIV